MYCCLPRSLTEALIRHSHMQTHTHTLVEPKGTDIVKVELEANEILLTFTTQIVRERQSPRV